MKGLVSGIIAAVCVAAAACSGGSSATSPTTSSPYAGSWSFVQGPCTWGPIVVSGSGTFGTSNGFCSSSPVNTLTGSISETGVVTGTQTFEAGATFKVTGTCATTVSCSGTVSGGAVQTWSLTR